MNRRCAFSNDEEEEERRGGGGGEEEEAEDVVDGRGKSLDEEDDKDFFYLRIQNVNENVQIQPVASPLSEFSLTGGKDCFIKIL